MSTNDPTPLPAGEVARVMLVAHHDRAADTATKIVEWLRARGMVVWAQPEDARRIGLPDIGAEHAASEADVVISLGGDGTMLRAARLLDGAPVPLLGVNLGRLGYLTEVDPGGVGEALDRWHRGPADGGWHIDERMLLDVSVADPTGAVIGSFRALNEVVAEKRDAGRTVGLLVHIDGEPFTSYETDGLIVSTPTGSTAYSLSARGPVVSPKHRALLITPVAPHMLFDRSLVLDPTETVDIEVVGDRTAAVAIDGQRVAELAEGASIRCAPSSATVGFVRFGEHRYHQVLKAKFGLTDR